MKPLNHLKQYLNYEFNVADGKSTDELIADLVEAAEKAAKDGNLRTFTEAELEDFCRNVILKLLRKAMEQEGITSINELLEELQEPDGSGEEWKDQ